MWTYISISDHSRNNNNNDNGDEGGESSKTEKEIKCVLVVSPEKYGCLSDFY
jgi:hypothetical protein